MSGALRAVTIACVLAYFGASAYHSGLIVLAGTLFGLSIVVAGGLLGIDLAIHLVMLVRLGVGFALIFRARGAPRST